MSEQSNGFANHQRGGMHLRPWRLPVLGLALLALLAVGACNPSGSSSGAPQGGSTVDLQVRTEFGGAGTAGLSAAMGTSRPMLARGTLADVVAVGVAVSETATGTPVLAETELTEISPGVWEGMLTGLPVGVSLDFHAVAYDGPFSGGVNLNLALFEDTVTQTLSAAGPNNLTFFMAAIDDGTSPTFPTVAVTMPGSVPATESALIAFAVSYEGPVNYAISVTDGTVSGSTAGSLDPAVNDTVAVTYTAPATPGLDTIQIVLSDVADPTSTVTYAFPISVGATASGDVTTLFGPTIMGLNFVRLQTALEISVNVTDGTLPYGFVWSGTGSFAALSSTSNPATISPFNDTDAGDVAVVVTDANGISASVTHTISAGEFPFSQGASTRLSDLLSSYDLFNGSDIDGQRWDRGEASLTVVGGTATGNQLQLRTEIGNTAVQPAFKGGWVNDNSLASFTQSMEATVTVSDYAISNANAEALLRLNVAPIATAGTTLLDFAGFDLRLRDTGAGLVKTAVGFLCTAADCSTTTGFSVLDSTFTFNQPVALNTGLTLRISYDPANAAYAGAATVTLEDVTNAEYHVLDVTGIATVDPAVSVFSPRVRTRIRDTGTPGGSGHMTVLYDNLSVDGGLVEDLETSPPLDNTRWGIGEQHRQLVNGQLVFTQVQSDHPGNNNLWFLREHPISAMSADVTVTEASNNSLDPDNRSRARLGGYFYNDGSTGDGLGGRNGDVWAEIAMDGDDVAYVVARCTTFSCSQLEAVTAGWNSLLPVGLGTPHTLYMAWDDVAQTFTFQVDDNPAVTFDPVVAGAPVAGAPKVQATRRTIGTRVTVGSGESGSVTARFDNVRTDVILP